MKRAFYLIAFFCFSNLFGQVSLDIGTTETLFLSANSIFSVDGITYTPSANKTLSNVTFSKSTSTANTTSINNIQKVISIANSWTNFSGSIRFTYLTSELNGLNENDLNISSFDGSTWTPLTATTVTAATNVASANLTATNISELTLQISATTTSTTTSTTVTPTSSGGGGGGGSSNPSVDPNDTDGDGIANALDAFPDDSKEWLDTDGDGIGDNADLDDDNDGISDLHEGLCFTDPKDPFDVPGDYDADGLPNCIDLDDDDDGYPDEDELLCGSNPLDETATPLDTDGDFLANCVDLDDDNDSYLDVDDAFPLNELEWVDTDGDKIGNNEDTDDDNDCYSDTLEVSQGSDPLDPSSTPADADLDCIPDELDPDDNNDGYPDGQVLISEFVSPNGDGINDTWQVKEIDRYPNNQVWIFTRTGYEVFNTLNYRNDWSGTKDGSPLPEGSYYFRIDLDGNGTIDFEGWLYLTR